MNAAPDDQACGKQLQRVRVDCLSGRGDLAGERTGKAGLVLDITGDGGCFVAIGADDVEQLLGRLGVQGAGIALGVDQMRLYVVLDDDGHQTGHRASGAGDQVHHLFAAGLQLQRALNGLHLSAQPADAGEQLLLLQDRVHWRQIA